MNKLALNSKNKPLLSVLS